MSKPPKTDFKALIAGQVAPAVEPSPKIPARVEDAPSAEVPAPAREIVSLKPRQSLSTEKPAKQRTLKQRAHQLSLYLEPAVYNALREIAYVERTKLHPLILEAIDMLLKKRGSPSIKQLTERAG